MTDEQLLPADEEQGLCPTCGFFVGPALTCVRCGARTGKRLSVNIIRWGSIVCSIIGLAILWLAAAAKEPDLIKIGDINEMMNGALIKVEGTLTEVKDNEEKNMLRLTVEDETGKITIMAFNKLHEFRNAWGENNPGAGDKLSVAGQVSISKQYGATIFLAVSERLIVVEKFEPDEIEIGELSLDDVDGIYRLSCDVANYEEYTTRNGNILHKFQLDNDGDRIELVVFSGQWSQIDDDTKRLLTRGRYPINIMVKIGEYNGELQATLFDTTHIERASRRRNSR